MTVIQQFEQYLKEQDRSPYTVKGYGHDLRMFTRWFEQTNGEAMTPQTVTPSDMREYRQYLVAIKQNRANTVNRRLIAVSRLMAWAIQQGVIEKNPLEDVKMMKVTQNSVRWLDRKQQFALQRAIEKDLQLSKLRYSKRWIGRQRDASLVLFMLNTGLRLQEVSHLRMDALNLAERKGQVRVIGKGKKERVVPLNATARKAVQDWLAVRPAMESEYLFPPIETPSNKPISARSLQRVIRRLGDDAGLPDLTPHMLRHTFAKNLVDSGVSLEKVAALLGHSNLNTTRIYITPNQQDLEKAVDQL